MKDLATDDTFCDFHNEPLEECERHGVAGTACGKISKPHRATDDTLPDPAWAYFKPLSTVGCMNWSDEIMNAFTAGIRYALNPTAGVPCANCGALRPAGVVDCKCEEDD